MMDTDLFNQYISLRFKPVRCYGDCSSNKETDLEAKRKKAKRPIEKGFKTDSIPPLTLSEVHKWESQGGWVGWLLPQGVVAIDAEVRDIIDAMLGICSHYDVTPPEDKTLKGIHLLFEDPHGIPGASEKETKAGFIVTYRAGGENILILPNTEGRTWTVPLNGGFPRIPKELTPWDDKDVNDVLNVLSWAVGDAYRDRIFTGYEDIDLAYMAYLDDHGMSEEQIHRAFEKVFLSELNFKRTQDLIDRLRNLKESGKPYVGAGSFVKAIQDKDLEKIRGYMSAFERLTKKENTKDKKTLQAITIKDFLSLELPPRENIVDPWLPTQGLIMIYGYRGIGKTFFIIGLSLAVSSGDKFLKWGVSKPFSVLHLDGEMPAVTVQERYAKLIASQEKEPLAQLKIITPDLQTSGMPNIAHPEGQEMIEEHLEGIDLVIVDNISTLCRYGRENETESWYPIQEWGLKLRSKRKSVVFVHHAGKGGFQRGTSSREDVLDTVINLKRPADYQPDQGARFEVHFEKARNVLGSDVKPFEAKLETHEGNLIWTLKDIEESLTDRIVDLLKEGIKQQDIADILGVAKGTVTKHKYKAEKEGKWKS